MSLPGPGPQKLTFRDQKTDKPTRINPERVTNTEYYQSLTSKTRWMFVKTRSRQNYLYSLSTNGSQARSGEQEQWVKSGIRRPAL